MTILGVHIVHTEDISMSDQLFLSLHSDTHVFGTAQVNLPRVDWTRDHPSVSMVGGSHHPLQLLGYLQPIFIKSPYFEEKFRKNRSQYISWFNLK